MADEIEFTDSSTDISSEDKNTVGGHLGEKAWYIATCYSTHESKVQANLIKRKETYDLGNLIHRIVIAEQEVPSIGKDGTPTGRTKKINLYPGYIFIEMVMTNHAWYVIRNTQGVTGFVGSSGKGTKPFPVPREQIEPVLKRMGIVDSGMYDRYKVDDKVRVIRGTLEGTEGVLKEFNKDTGVAQIEVTFFGRSTVVEVGFDEIEKL